MDKSKSVGKSVGPARGQKTLVITTTDISSQNAFDKAREENERYEKRLLEEKMKLDQFKQKVKERIKVYKHVEQRIDEDTKLRINQSKHGVPVQRSKSADYSKTIKRDLVSNKKRVKSEKSSARQLASVETKMSKMQLSSPSLPNFLVKSMIDQNNLKKMIEENKKRIMSTRRLYSNMEREGVQQASRAPSAQSGIQIKVEKNPELEFIKRQLDMNQASYKDYERTKPVIKSARNKPSTPTKKKSSAKLSAPPSTTPSSTYTMERYIRYLKQSLRDKAVQYRVDPPLLCQCNLNQKVHVWDIDWNKCANNCLFYKNPKGFIL